MPRSLWAALLGVALFVASASPARACTCVSAEPFYSAKHFRESRNRAVLVFRGKVLELKTRDENAYLGAPIAIKHTVALFNASQIWKGPRPELEVHFRGGPESALCEYPFEIGKEYLVFAYGEEPTAAACDFTMLASH